MIFGAFHRFLVISSIDKIRWTRKVSYKIREFHDLQNVWLLVVNISGQLSRGAWVRQFASTEVHHARVPSLPQHLPTLDIRYTMIHSWLGWFFSWLFLIVFFGWFFFFLEAAFEWMAISTALECFNKEFLPQSLTQKETGDPFDFAYHGKKCDQRQTWSWYVWVKALICMQMPKGFQNESTQNWVTWSLVLKIIVYWVYCLQPLTASQATALWWYLQLSMLWSFPESCDSSFISWAKWEKRFSGGFVGSIFAPIPHEMRGKWGHGGPKLFILVDSAQEYFSSCSYKSLLLGIRGQVNEVSRLIKLVHTQTEVFKDVHGLSLPYDF